MLGLDNPWPATSPTSATQVIKSYVYQQYKDDDEVSAFFDAYNIYAQAYVDLFNSMNLANYTKDPISGEFLDWMAQCLYGMLRPALPANLGSPYNGPVNTFAVNALPVNGYNPGIAETYTATSDDTFRRVLTWHIYRGDGKVFTPRWLKRRINRFLNGVNGTDVTNDTTYDISVTMTGFKAWKITLPTTTQSKIFKIALETGALEVPLQITFTVDLV